MEVNCDSSKQQFSYEKLVSVTRVGPKCGTHTSSAVQTHFITGYHSTHDFLHLEDFRHSDVEFCFELEFN